jgi:hypothetical protein
MYLVLSAFTFSPERTHNVTNNIVVANTNTKLLYSMNPKKLRPNKGIPFLTIAQLVSHQPLNAKTHVRSQASACDICGWLIDTGIGFSHEYLIFPLSLSSHACFILVFFYMFLFPKGKTGEAWGLSSEHSLWNRGALVRKVVSLFFTCICLTAGFFRVTLKSREPYRTFRDVTPEPLTVMRYIITCVEVRVVGG